MWYNSFTNIALVQSLDCTKKLNKMKNAQEFQNWFAELLETATNRYKITGLPDTCNERVILQSFLWYGGCVFFEIEGSLLSLPGMPTTDYSLYGDAGYAYVYGRNGFNKKIKLVIPNAESKVVSKGVSGNQMGDTGEGVYIRERKNVYPFINYVISYAAKIADCSRTLDVQRFQMKRPYMITAEETVVPTVRKWMKSVGDNEEAIISTGVFPADKVAVVPLTVSGEDIKAVRELIEWYLSQFRELCGINSNPNTDKKANLLVDEINVNNEATEESVSDIVDYMQEQFDLVNRRFGTNIRVEVKKDDEVQELSGSESESVSDNVGE